MGVIPRYNFWVPGGLDSVDTHNGNVDVHVTIEKKGYSATFFTLDNIDSLMRKFEQEGDCNHGQYFRAVDMIIVRELSLCTIQETIDYMLGTGEFFAAFGGPYEVIEPIDL